MDRSAFYRSRNGFFIVLVWVLLILNVLRDPMLSSDDPRLLFMIITGGLACCLPTFLHVKNRSPATIPYLSAALFSLMTFYELARHFCLFSFLLLYISILVFSLYSNFRLILFNGCLVMTSMIMVIQIFQTNNEFMTNNLLLFLGGSLLTTAVLVIHARRFEQTSYVLASRTQTCEQIHIRTNAAAVDLHSTADLLHSWSTELELELQHASQICQDIRKSLEYANDRIEGIWNKGTARPLGDQTSTAVLPDAAEIRERLLRITAKTLHLSEHMEANKQAIEDIHAGLSHQYGKLSDLIDKIQSPNSAAKQKADYVNDAPLFSPAFLTRFKIR
ncbi:hypothetical protein AWM70_18085 [Paenibacillus yonginensis]|uniref:Methyl-accepting transducer domain-containing protein n=1 Tax=Paenibacillus yonginensis TaxID=1462996 RepID=A0A1B1N4B6_9BACL|nr:hypothetical protein [Paenibacillus yonginensis]ANS76257.1 hypothetical protein AWM70_18085 [Paenibacillus yonginensis]